jgi:integrase
VINADPLAFEVLREYRVKQQAQAKICGAAWGDASYNGSGLIFTAWNGEILPPNQPYDWFKEFCKKFGLPFRNIHSLRHYRTSYRIAKGDNIYDVSADLGHSQLTTTLNLYAHEFNMRGARERGKQLKSEMFSIDTFAGGSERD